MNENTENIESNEDRSEDNSLNQDVFQIPCYNDFLVMFSSTSGKVLDMTTNLHRFHSKVDDVYLYYFVNYF